ncbi:MAG: small basic protein [Sedimentisphaerales bacterium]|nr:small basic protein [Sedimentisphaerales bacterium]
MSIDSSLKVKDTLSRHRNVLSRAERLEMLKEQERWNEDSSVLGLPKVSHRKSVAGKKEKVEKVAEGTEAVAAVATGAKPAAGAKAPAAAAKAPAAKTDAKKK